MGDGYGARIRRRLFLANASYDDLSNTRTPQNRDSYELVELRVVIFFVVVFSLQRADAIKNPATIWRNLSTTRRESDTQ